MLQFLHEKVGDNHRMGNTIIEKVKADDIRESAQPRKKEDKGKGLAITAGDPSSKRERQQ